MRTDRFRLGSASWQGDGRKRRPTGYWWRLPRSKPIDDAHGSVPAASLPDRMDDAPGSATIHPKRAGPESGTLRHLAGSHALRAPVDALRDGWMNGEASGSRACRSGTFADRLASPGRCSRNAGMIA